jgi:hypothetical protein
VGAENAQGVIPAGNQPVMQQLPARNPGSRGRGRIAEGDFTALEIGERLGGTVGGDDDHRLKSRADA